jgi:exodeoxyribonuclease-3
MRLRVVTWNVNSVRLRADQVARFVAEHDPDVVCLQEIKCRDGEFPAQAFAAMGLPHLMIKGQKGSHGVAIASRLPLEPGPGLGACPRGEAREVSALVAGVEIHSLYVPAGGDVPDRTVNPKFEHKLDFLHRLAGALSRRDPTAPLLIGGDLNVAPSAFDVWNHRHMSRVVSHTPVEVEAMAVLQASLNFTDLVRQARPEPETLFTWWSYRAADFRASGRGLRLDHLWASPGLNRVCAARGAGDVRIHEDVRAWDRPSDHAPVSVDLDV